jgi:cell division protein FtsN
MASMLATITNSMLPGSDERIASVFKLVAKEEMACIAANPEESPAERAVREQVGAFDEPEALFDPGPPEEERRDRQEQLVDETRLKERTEDARTTFRQDPPVAASLERIDRRGGVELAGCAE